MSAIGFVRKALAMGVDLETALAMGEAFEAAHPVYVPPVGIVVDPTMERRRAYDRERQAEKRAAAKAAKAASTGHPPTSAESAESTGRPLDIDPAKDAPAPVHTRVEDNPSRLVDTGPNHTSPQRERDWKNRADLEWLDGQLREAGGPAIANMAIAPGLGDLSVITGLLTGGTGPPCDLEADVLPIVRARCVGRKAGSVRGWYLFRDAIREARDRRLTGAPAIEPIHQGPRHERPHQPSSRIERTQANMARALRGAESAAARRTV